MTASSNSNFVIVDTGCANLFSVKVAVERLGFSVVISDNSTVISQADKVILPGVGSAQFAMATIARKNLTTTLQNLTQPVLGFCLGMQLMAESSTEGIEPSTKSKAPPAEDNALAANNLVAVPCLGLIPTAITPLQANGYRLPHMGWNTLTKVSEHPIFNGIKAQDYFYFVHSFAAPISEFTIATCEYGSAFSAAIAKDNFIGCQFHPERSGALGSKIIHNFLTM